MYCVLHKLGRGLRIAWLQAGIFIVLLVVVDSAIRIGIYLTTARTVDSRVTADGYTGSAWVTTYFADLAGAWVKWNPYSYWIGAPYRSRYLNIGADGLRATIAGNHPHDPAHKPIRIFVFGGSTMWGEGARDAYTIPSWLQRMLDDSPYDVRVSNYGQDGYVNSQEMILLFEQLRRGNIPSLVIFYDGFNDCTSAMINRAAGETFGEENRRIEFNAFNQWATANSILYKRAATTFAINSGLGRVASKIVQVLEPRRFEERNGELIAMQTDRDYIGGMPGPEIQEQVVQVYLADKRLIEAAGRSFGFKALFFWQPTVWTKARLTDYEAQQKWLPGEKQFMTAVYQRVAATAQPQDIHDLSGIFGTSRRPYFIDDAHLTEEGNRIVAQAMLPLVLKALSEGASERPQPSAAPSPR
jgi:lysophospholipase L1-like esterase